MAAVDLVVDAAARDVPVAPAVLVVVAVLVGALVECNGARILGLAADEELPSGAVESIVVSESVVADAVEAGVLGAVNGRVGLVTALANGRDVLGAAVELAVGLGLVVVEDAVPVAAAAVEEDLDGASL